VPFLLTLGVVFSYSSVVTPAGGVNVCATPCSMRGKLPCHVTMIQGLRSRGVLSMRIRVIGLAWRMWWGHSSSKLMLRCACGMASSCSGMNRRAGCNWSWTSHHAIPLWHVVLPTYPPGAYPWRRRGIGSPPGLVGPPFVSHHRRSIEWLP
jgi:hypothetical protein